MKLIILVVVAAAMSAPDGPSTGARLNEMVAVDSASHPPRRQWLDTAKFDALFAIRHVEFGRFQGKVRLEGICGQIHICEL